MSERTRIGQYLHSPHVDIASSDGSDGSENSERDLPEQRKLELMLGFGPFRPLPRSEKTSRADSDARSQQSQAAADDDAAPTRSTTPVVVEPASAKPQSETEDAMSPHDAESRSIDNDVHETPNAASHAVSLDTVEASLGLPRIDDLIEGRFEAELDELVARSLECLIVRRARSRLAELAAPGTDRQPTGSLTA